MNELIGESNQSLPPPFGINSSEGSLGRLKVLQAWVRPSLRALGKSSSNTLGNEISGQMVLNIATWIQVSQGVTKGAIREKF